jgi:drug/metabolite transporter (DMT)-like permease
MRRTGIGAGPPADPGQSRKCARRRDKMGKRDPSSARAASAPVRAAVGRGDEAIPPLALVLLASLTVLWGVNWPAMKVALLEIPVWTFRVITMGISGPLLLLGARLMGEPVGIPPGRLRPMALVALFNVTGWHLCSAYGVLLIESGRAAIIAFTMPVWAALFGVLLLGERLDLRRIVALVLGLGAVLVLVAPDLHAFGAAPLGALLMVGAAICWGAGTVGIKLVDWRMPAMALAGWQILIGAVPIVVGWPLLEPWPDLSGVGLEAWLGTLYTATVALVFCFGAFTKVVTLVPANVAAIGTLAIPIVGLFSSALLLGEPAGPRELTALALVVAALALVLLRRPGRR